MATKIEWSASDYAAQRIIARIYTGSGLSYRAVESRVNIGISFTRVRDIVQGRRAPVRLSEFLAICDICGADPAETLREIIAEAKRIEEERDRERRVEETKRILEEHPLELAAYTDPDKAMYIEHGDGDDPA